MNEQLEIGDVVQLIAGGPKMTVEHVFADSSKVDVVWFMADSAGVWIAELFKATIARAALVKVVSS